MAQEGATPPGDPLELKFSESMTVEEELGYKSYVLAADLDCFIDYLDNDPEGKLFARNVRLDLGSDINKNIKETYLTSPGEFWYSHNGITVICSNATITGKSIRLINPSVINGSQTLNSLRGIDKKKRGENVKVLTRVLVVTRGERDEESSSTTNKFVNDIIYRTNQQNKMYSYDLRATDVRQVALAKDFLKNGVFYERRRGEWRKRQRDFKNQGIEKVNSVELAQILAAFNPKIGVAIAKKGKEDLFTHYYDDIFYADFNEIYVALRLFKHINQVINKMKYRKTTPRIRKHALLTVATICSDMIKKSKYYKNFLSSPQYINMLSTGESQIKRLEIVVQNIFEDCWKSWRKENKKDPTLSPNNYFKAASWNQHLRDKLSRRYSAKGNKALGLICKM